MSKPIKPKSWHEQERLRWQQRVFGPIFQQPTQKVHQSSIPKWESGQWWVCPKDGTNCMDRPKCPMCATPRFVNIDPEMVRRDRRK